MNIIVTGAGKNGFLGKHVKKAFEPLKLTNEIYFFGSNIDLTNPKESIYLLREFKPDIIVHMAAVCGGILANKNSPADFLTKNTLMGIYMYEAARQYSERYGKSPKIYTLGSACSYPLNCPIPFKEDDLFNGYPESSNAPYGQSKRTLLMLGQTYREQYGIGGAHLIPANMMGEWDHFDLTNSHVIPALINKFVNAKDKNLPTVEVWGTGEATREFLYAGDCAEAIVKSVKMELDTPLPINIGTGKDISIKDLAYLLRQIIDYKGEIVFTGEVSDGQPKRRLDVSRAKEILDFEARTNLKIGLTKTIIWYLDCKKKRVL